jgi:hypothetical protein
MLAVLVFAVFAAHVVAWIALPDRKAGGQSREVAPSFASAAAQA